MRLYHNFFTLSLNLKILFPRPAKWDSSQSKQSLSSFQYILCILVYTLKDQITCSMVDCSEENKTVLNSFDAIVQESFFCINFLSIRLSMLLVTKSDSVWRRFAVHTSIHLTSIHSMAHSLTCSLPHMYVNNKKRLLLCVIRDERSMNWLGTFNGVLSSSSRPIYVCTRIHIR